MRPREVDFEGVPGRRREGKPLKAEKRPERGSAGRGRGWGVPGVLPSDP